MLGPFFYVFWAGSPRVYNGGSLRCWPRPPSPTKYTFGSNSDVSCSSGCTQPRQMCAGGSGVFFRGPYSGLPGTRHSRPLGWGWACCGATPPPAREPAGGSSSRAPPGSRSAKRAPAREHGARTHGIGPPALGLRGRSPLGAWEGGAIPDSARKPASGSSSRAPAGSRGARKGQGLEWRDAVAEVVRSKVTRSLVTMLPGSTPRPAECRGRGRRSSRRRRQDDSSSSSTTDVSLSADEAAVAALLGAFRATPTT